MGVAASCKVPTALGGGRKGVGGWTPGLPAASMMRTYESTSSPRSYVLILGAIAHSMSVAVRSTEYSFYGTTSSK